MIAYFNHVSLFIPHQPVNQPVNWSVSPSTKQPLSFTKTHSRSIYVVTPWPSHSLMTFSVRFSALTTPGVYQSIRNSHNQTSINQSTTNQRARQNGWPANQPTTSQPVNQPTSQPGNESRNNSIKNQGPLRPDLYHIWCIMVPCPVFWSWG